MIVLIIVAAVVVTAAAVTASIVFRVKRNERTKCFRAAEVLAHYDILTLKLRNTPKPHGQTGDRIMLYLKCTDKIQGVHAVFDVENKVRFGRDPHTNEVFIEDMSVSGNHCRIEQIDGKVYLRDLRSSNGTVLKRGPVQSCVLVNGERAEILSGDRVCVGSCEFKVCLFSYNSLTM